MWRLEVFGARPFRLALTFALAISAVMLAAFGFIYLEVSRANAERVGAILAEEANANKDASDENLRMALAARQTAHVRRIDYLALYDAAGTLRLGNVPRRAAVPVDGRPHSLSAREMAALGVRDEPAIVVECRRADGGVTLFGRNLQEARDVETSLLRALALALAPTVALILAVGIWIGGRELARLDGVRGAILRIIEGDLDRRLPVSRNRDEIDRIAEAVNLMLDEIVRLLDQLKSVGDNIAHDLRTPIAVARAKLERMLQEEATPAHAPLAAALSQLDRAAVTISALLRISAVENGPRHKHFADVDLAGVAQDALEFYAPLAEAKGLALGVSAPSAALIRGDEDLLREAVSNLVENAIKYTPGGGAVEIVVGVVDGRPCLEVRDTGPGVAPAKREAIFRRFYKGADGGAGIGLSIARTIAELHGFELRVEDNAPGARFVMRAAAKAALTRRAMGEDAGL